MAAFTEYLPVAAASTANVDSQSNFAGSAYQQNGFMTGTAKSFQANKVWRQATMCSATWAALIVQVLGQNVPDDGNLTNLQIQYQTLITNLANAAITASGLIARMTAAEGNISALQGTVNGLSTTVAGHTSQINALQTSMTTAQGNISTLQSQMAGALANISTLQTQMGTANANIGTLQSQMSAANSHLSSLDGQVAALMPTSGSGWLQLPNGYIFQWAQGAIDTSAGTVTQTVNFPKPFPHNCFIPQVTTKWNAGADQDLMSYQVTSWSNASVNLRRGRRGDDNTMTTQPLVFAIGN
jgi:hypothetical protein